MRIRDAFALAGQKLGPIRIGCAVHAACADVAGPDVRIDGGAKLFPKQRTTKPELDAATTKHEDSPLSSTGVRPLLAWHDGVGRNLDLQPAQILVEE